MKKKFTQKTVHSISLLILICLASLFVTGSGSRPREAPSKIKSEKKNLKIDEKFFDLTAKTLDNKEIKFSDYKGKVLVIDFWASWCPPCVMEIPHFIELQKEYNDSNVQIIGISKDNSSATVKEFIKRTNINYPVIMDMPELSDFFGSITSIPTTFILDKNANIIEKAVGYRDKSFFEKEIEQLL